MDSFELNKIIGAVLGTLLFVMGVGFLAEAIYHPIEDRGPGFTLPEPEGGSTEHGGPGEPEAPPAPIGALLASADPVQGEADAQKCKGCHTFTDGGANGTGPNLWNIVNRPIASHAGFAYSPAMQEHAQEVPDWTYDELNAFLLAPKARVPDTKMGFAGVKDDAERANIIAYLSTLSSSPVPFPPPEAAPPAEGEAAPAEGAAPPAEGAAPAAEAAAPADVTAPAAEAPAAEAAPAETAPATEPAAAAGETATPAAQ
jgi:cytochrome c